MNELNNTHKDDEIESSAQEQSTPASDKAPMFNRSAGGQYSSEQPDLSQLDGPSPSYTAPPLQFKKKPLDRQSMRLGDAVGMPLSMFFIGGYVIQFIIVLIISIASPSALNIFSDSNVAYALSSVITLTVLTVPYIYTLKATKMPLTELIRIKKVSRTKTVSLIMLGLGVTAISNIANNLLASFSESFLGIKFEASMPEFKTDIWSFALMLLCVGILPAVLEEIALRGFVLGALRTKFSDASAIVISAALFSLLHGNLQQIPFAFLMGLLLAYATVYCDSIIPSVIIHAINNVFSVVLSFASVDMSPMISQIVGLLYFAVCLVIGLCGFIMLTKTDKSAFRIQSDASEGSKENLKGFFASGWVIAFIILSVVQILSVQGVIKL